MSARRETPPEAITPMEPDASSTSSMAGRLGPCRVPSRPMSVNRIRATPAPQRRSTTSQVPSEEDSRHPASCTVPPRASTAATTPSPNRGPSRACASARKLSSTARVPTQTRAAPASSHRSTASTDRMPPATWTGISTAPRTRLITAALDGSPVMAPSRSTTCSHVAPPSCHARAVATGSSPYTVAAFGSPRVRRTTRPPDRSMATKTVNTPPSAGERPEGPGQQSQAVVAALLRVELHPDDVARRHRRGERLVVGRPGRDRAGGRDAGVGVDEVEVALLEAPQEPHGVLEGVPAHVRDLDLALLRGDRILWRTEAVSTESCYSPRTPLQAYHLAGQDAEALRVALLRVLEEELHAHADAEERLA